MAVHRLSRYSFTSGLDKDDVFQLTDREPFRYAQYPDTILHTVKTSDTLFTLAAKFYAGAPRPAGLWWVLADFQPDPIIDPTLSLALGRTIFIPSLRTVTEEVFATDRRAESRVR